MPLQNRAVINSLLTQIRLAKTASIYDPELRQLRNQLKEACRTALLSEPELTQQNQEIDALLWKHAFYLCIDGFRQRLKTTEGELLTKTTTAYGIFLKEAQEYYISLAKDLQTCYGNVGFHHHHDNNNNNNRKSLDISILIARILVCIGDLERYSVQLNISNNAGDDKTTTMMWTACANWYVQSIAISQVYGNAYNQLAVIAAYQHKEAITAYYYTRALAAPKPFPNVAQNLEQLAERARQHTLHLLGKTTTTNKTQLGDVLQALHIRFALAIGTLSSRIDIDKFAGFIEAGCVDLDQYLYKQRVYRAKKAAQEAKRRKADVLGHGAKDLSSSLVAKKTTSDGDDDGNNQVEVVVAIVASFFHYAATHDASNATPDTTSNSNSAAAAAVAVQVQQLATAAVYTIGTTVLACLLDILHPQQAAGDGKKNTTTRGRSSTGASQPKPTRASLLYQMSYFLAPLRIILMWMSQQAQHGMGFLTQTSQQQQVFLIKSSTSFVTKLTEFSQALADCQPLQSIITVDSGQHTRGALAEDYWLKGYPPLQKAHESLLLLSGSTPTTTIMNDEADYKERLQQCLYYITLIADGLIQDSSITELLQNTETTSTSLLLTALQGFIKNHVDESEAMEVEEEIIYAPLRKTPTPPPLPAIGNTTATNEDDDDAMEQTVKEMAWQVLEDDDVPAADALPTPSFLNFNTTPNMGGQQQWPQQQQPPGSSIWAAATTGAPGQQQQQQPLPAEGLRGFLFGR